MKIGILYVKGALPLFEDFGNLPTHTVNINGMVNGVNAHKVLDGLILPGGSMVESINITPKLQREVEEMARQGKFILGMCSGFQLLANSTNIGRKSPCPIIKKGMGLLDVTFDPLISNDRVEAEIKSPSFLTEGMMGGIITGFHCHTYGKISGDATPLCYSQVKRMNYQDRHQQVLSGACNDDGNVVGIMLHASLDENPLLVENILGYLGAEEKDIQDIKNQNLELKKKIKRELGVETSIFAQERLKTSSYDNSSPKKLDENSNYPPILMMGSTGSDSGKTFLTTGIVGTLRKMGYKIGVLKVGPDIRDIVPSLYLNKEKMENFSSIKIGHLGWKELESVLNILVNKKYDLVIVEGVMSVFTGLLNEKIPYSSAEIAQAGKIPVLLVSACNKGGIETAAVDLVSHANMLNKLGVKVSGLILNKVYDTKIGENAVEYIKTNTGLEFVEMVPKIKLIERGNIPEVELKLEEFCLHAMEAVENNLDPQKIKSLAVKPDFTGYMDYPDILKKFK